MKTCLIVGDGLCARCARGGSRRWRRGGTGTEAQRGRAEGRPERGAEGRAGNTACRHTAASPSAWSVSLPASSASLTSRNAQSHKEVYAPCSREILIEWHRNKKSCILAYVGFFYRETLSITATMPRLFILGLYQTSRERSEHLIRGKSSKEREVNGECSI